MPNGNARWQNQPRRQPYQKGNDNQNFKQENSKAPSYLTDENYKSLKENADFVLNEIKQTGFLNGEKKNLELAKALEKFAEFLNCSYLKGKDKGVSSSGLRNIYDHYIGIKRSYELKINEIYAKNLIDSFKGKGLDGIKQEAFEYIKPQLIFAKGKVNYSVEKKMKELKVEAVKEAYGYLKKFIFESTNKILDSDEKAFAQFEAFLDMFETLVAFMK